MRRAASLLLAALLYCASITVFEDGSVQLLNSPALSFCVPGGLCQEGNR